jgi:hypothetical protein
METTRPCPSCGRTLGPQATRCFYCGQALPTLEPYVPGPVVMAPPEAPSAPAEGLPGTPPAAAAVPLPEVKAPPAPNTLCPVCRNTIVAEARPDFVCPSCQGNLECLYAAGAVPAPAAVPVPRNMISEICTFHPGVQAIGRCKNCRKAVCETCAFRMRIGLYCPDCASAPDEQLRRSTTSRGVISLVCGAAALIMMVVTFVSAAMAGKAEGIATCLFLVTLILALTGIATGFMSRDPARGRSVTGLIGLIISFLVLGIYALLIVASMVNK